MVPDRSDRGGQQLAAFHWFQSIPLRRPVIATMAMGLAVAVGAVLGVYWQRPAPITTLPQTVLITPHPFLAEAAGSFRQDGKATAAPVVTVPPGMRFEIMKYQVSQTDYAACVDENACAPTQTDVSGPLPQTGISFVDAQAYAAWFARRTGQSWRLPSDAEWLAAAADRVRAPNPVDAHISDPSVRWLRSYRQNVQDRGDADPQLRPPGAFGENRHGVADMAGNVWEWTQTCFDRITLAPDGMSEISRVPNCGVRVAQGKHRAYVVDFIRDAKAGGCAAGIPPDHLGFRLVRDPE